MQYTFLSRFCPGRIKRHREVYNQAQPRQESSLAWFSSERLNQQLTGTDADTYSQPLEWSHFPYGWIRAWMEKTEEEGDPIGKPAVSTNLDSLKHWATNQAVYTRWSKALIHIYQTV